MHLLPQLWRQALPRRNPLVSYVVYLKVLVSSMSLFTFIHQVPSSFHDYSADTLQGSIEAERDNLARSAARHYRTAFGLCTDLMALADANLPSLLGAVLDPMSQLAPLGAAAAAAGGVAGSQLLDEMDAAVLNAERACTELK